MRRKLQTLIAVITVAVISGVLVACGQSQEPAPELPQPPQPLQSPIQPPGNVTIVPAGTVTSVPTVPTVTAPATSTTVVITATQQLVPTVVRTPFVPANGTPGTPDTRATSQSVIMTLTALALPPTRGPTSTATRRSAVGASGGRVRVTHVPTPTMDPSGVTLLSVSRKVFRGGAITLSIRTKPGAQCQIKATGTQANGAAVNIVIPNATRKAASDGAVAWIWPVDANVPTGSLALRADCGSAGAAQYAIDVQP